MNIEPYQKTIRSAAALGVAVVIIGGLLSCLAAETNAVSTAKSKPAARKLTGADLYNIHCNRCHAERYPTEWDSREWQTLMTHMRVRANLPASQSREILKYLKENSGGN